MTTRNSGLTPGKLFAIAVRERSPELILQRKRNVSKMAGLILLASFALHGFSSEKILPIGFFVDTIEVSEDDPFRAHARVTRDGESVDAIQGMEVYPGDVVDTPAEGGIAVALLNNNIVELGAITRLTIENGGLTNHELGKVVINSGTATVTTRSLLSAGLEIGLGESSSPFARALVSKPTKLDIVVLPDATAPGGYVTTVFATAGSATLTPVNGQQVDIGSLGVKLLTANTPVTGVTTSQVTIAPTTTTKSDLKAAQNAYKSVTSGSEILVSVGKGGLVTFKTSIKYPGGALAKGAFTTLNGNLTKDTWKTKGANRYSASWTEDVAKGKISVKQTFNGLTFSAVMFGNTTFKASLKGVDGQIYKGTATVDPKTGIITFVTTNPGKDGSTATFKYNPNDPAGPTQTVVISTIAGDLRATIVHSIPKGPPPATLPDGHAIEQNNPPSTISGFK